MLGMREIRRRIRSANSIQQITRAMEMVAVSRLRRAEERLHSARPYAEKIQELMQSLAPSLPRIDHPLLAQREVQRIAVVLITSDKGLCGAFNANIIQKTNRFLEENTDKEIKLFLVGKKGHDFFSRRPFSIEFYLPQISRDVSPQEVKKISQSFVQGFESDLHDEVYLFYTEFRSAMTTIPTMVRLLPVKSPQTDAARGQPAEPTFEPSAEEIMNELLPRYIEAQIYKGLVESSASEHGSRMVSMKNATDNAEEMIRSLTLTYNKVRQAAITKEIIEVTTASEALKYAATGGL
jgi:F-type H+-transporting ATPase subunit gamma